MTSSGWQKFKTWVWRQWVRLPRVRFTFHKNGYNPPKYGYMCAIDYSCELGEAAGGNTIYPSESDCLRRTCIDNCGMVRVRVELDKIVRVGRDFANAA